MGPRTRERRAGAVQSTNDSSALSKSSLAARGYVHDAFAALLVPGTARRAPLIHRGYYVRARAVRHCVRAFLEQTCAAPGAPRAQILSLGAGSDSLYFRLKAAGRLARTTVWEVDFPDVARAKAERIRDSPELRALAGPERDPDAAAAASALCFQSPDYRLLGLDLRRLQPLERALRAAGLDAAAPTLLLAEAVLTYLEPDAAAALLAWAARHFEEALFVVYEQTRPHDAFGQVMQRHFRQLRSPLHGLERFPDAEAQRRRFLEAGWTACRALDMNAFYRRLVPAEERRRAEQLEPFDEFEEWHLKCAHYFILAASRGRTLSPVPLLPPAEASSGPEPSPSASGAFPAGVVASDGGDLSLRRYGHASVLLSPGLVLSAGGFGEQEGRHCRVSRLHALRRGASGWEGTHLGGRGAEWDGRMHHTATRLSDTRAVVLGGRRSPVAAASGILQLDVCESGDGTSTGGLSLTVTRAGPEEEDSALSRWRHSTTEVTHENERYLFVYGGRSVLDPVLSDWCFLHVGTMAWGRVPVEGPVPEGRHSHSACSWRGGALIAGGLGVSEEPLSSVFFLKPVARGFLWEPLDIQPPVTPRYSHTAHVLNGHLLLVGGVCIHSSSAAPEVVVINLSTGSSSEYQVDTASVPWPLMLHNHTSILLPEEEKLLLLGGGGNCFSFGTYFNPRPVALDISSLKQKQPFFSG